MDIESKEPANDASCSFKDESVELLLKTSKSEYENEHNRTSIIDSKTNISLPIISAFFLALIQLNDYKAIFRLHTMYIFYNGYYQQRFLLHILLH